MSDEFDSDVFESGFDSDGLDDDTFDFDFGTSSDFTCPSCGYSANLREFIAEDTPSGQEVPHCPVCHHTDFSAWDE